MTSKKYSNAILDKNGGLHSRRALKTVRQAMTTHRFKRPILYHVILSGKSTKKEYQATIKRLIEHIRTKCKAEYIGAYEVGEEKHGLHCHMFVIVETLDHFPGDDVLNVSVGKFIARRIALTGMSIKIAPPQNTMHGGAMFARMDTPAKLANCIDWTTYTLKLRSKDAVPGREIYFGSCHAANARKREARRQKYRDALTKSSRPAAANPSPLSVPRLEGQITLTEKETQYEGHTTPECPGQGHTSTGTESPASSPYASASGIYGQPGMGQAGQGPRVPACSASTSTEAEAIRHGQAHGGAAGPAGKADLPITHSPGEAMLTTAQKYIASRYEEAVDLQLDVGAVRRYLLARGIRHTPAQVVHQLDNVLCFAGYAASHPAPAQADLDAIDRAIDRMTPQEIRRLPIPTAWTYGRQESRLTRVCLSEPSKLSHKLGSIGLTVSEPTSIIEPSTLLSQQRSQA